MPPVLVLADHALHAAALALALTSLGVPAEPWDGHMPDAHEAGAAAVVDITPTLGAHRVLAGAYRLRANTPGLRTTLVLHVDDDWSALREAALHLRPDHLVAGGVGLADLAQLTTRATPSPVPRPLNLGLRPSQRRVLYELACRPDRRGRLAMRLGLSNSTIDDHVRAITRCVNDTLRSDQQVASTEALIGWARDHHFHLVDPDLGGRE